MLDPVRQAWRDRVDEVAIEPDLPIVDPHHHLFQVAPRPQLEPCLPEEWFEEVAESGHRIVATVHVDAFSNYREHGPEALRPVGETEYVESVAQQAAHRGGSLAGMCAGIVANAELMLGEAVGEVLDAQLAASPRVVGVRRMTIFDDELPGGLPGHRVAGMLSVPAFRDGLRQVARRGLSFDAGVVQSQLLELADAAQACPELTFVLGHAGTPLGIGRYAERRAEAFAQWRGGMAALAALPNVVVKIGGLNMPFTGLGVDPAANRPLTSTEMAARQRDHVLTAIDLFGPDRCMFESNFPVDRWYTSYRVLWNAFKIITRGFSAAERAQMFGGAAARAYRIRLPLASPLAAVAA